MRLEYGGADVTQAFHWLLKKSAFPYKEFDEKLPQDAMLMKSLKEEFCHVNLDICGSQEKQFKICQRNKITTRYTIQVGDECVVAPLSLFNTELLNITGVGKIARVQKPSRQQPDPEDCFDAEYLRETGVSISQKTILIKANKCIFSFRGKAQENNWIKAKPKEQE